LSVISCATAFDVEKSMTSELAAGCCIVASHSANRQPVGRPSLSRRKRSIRCS
jgi:hypothetical protein